MSFWRLLAGLFDFAWSAERFVRNWRLNVAFWSGGLLAVVVMLAFHGNSVGQIAAGILFLSALVLGFFWDAANSR